MSLLRKIRYLLGNPRKKSESENSLLGKFILITGTGHCGTAWLAHVLHRPANGMVCYHEHKNYITGLDFKASLRHELEKGIDGLFDSYWNFIKEQQKHYRVVGDSNSWTIYMIPEVASKIGLERIIYLVRNGIQSVHSNFYHNTDMPRSDWIYTHFHRRYWELLDSPGSNWNSYTDWAHWCFWWQLNYVMPDWLAERLGSEKIIVYRFEDLLQDVELLLSLLQQLNPHIRISYRKLKGLQLMDINRKIQGDRSPEVLWKQWTDEQREVFSRICGLGMRQYGYPIPPRP